jgi:hypothetical protein
MLGIDSIAIQPNPMPFANFAPTGFTILPDILGRIADAPAELRIGPDLQLRAVTCLDGAAVPHSSPVLVRFGYKPPDSNLLNVYTVGAINLVEVWHTTPFKNGPSDFQEFLRSWRMPYGTAIGPGNFVPHVSAIRQPSRSGWSDQPCWLVRIDEQNAPQSTSPPGPFFSDEFNFFAVNPSDAAIQWLRADGLREMPSMSGSPAVMLIIDDNRVQIQSVDRDGSNVIVTVKSELGTLPLWGAVYAIDYEGRRIRTRARVVEGRAVVDIGRTVRDVRVFVFDGGGFLYDEWRDGDRGPLWGPSILRNSPEVSGLEEEIAELLARGGENETVEVKEWLEPGPGGKKCDELLETLCAFANTNGGSLYVGIDDHINPFDVMKVLPAWVVRHFPAVTRVPEEMRAQYARSIRDVATKLIWPSVVCDTQWVEVGSCSILRVRVEPTGQPVHYLVENNETYVRRGASNRRLRGPDWPTVVSAARA